MIYISVIFIRQWLKLNFAENFEKPKIAVLTVTLTHFKQIFYFYTYENVRKPEV